MPEHHALMQDASAPAWARLRGYINDASDAPCFVPFPEPHYPHVAHNEAHKSHLKIPEATDGGPRRSFVHAWSWAGPSRGPASGCGFRDRPGQEQERRESPGGCGPA